MTKKSKVGNGGPDTEIGESSLTKISGSDQSGYHGCRFVRKVGEAKCRFVRKVGEAKCRS